jgi:hypothetical protein
MRVALLEKIAGRHAHAKNDVTLILVYAVDYYQAYAAMTSYILKTI